MADTTFLSDLAVVLMVAAVTTVIFYRLRLPVVLGYLVAGIVVSPATPPRGLIAGTESIETISEIGLVVLLFSLGLEWSLGAVRRLGPGVLLATPIEVVLTFAGGYGLGRLFGWSAGDAALLGAAISISSTVIIMKTLTELGQMDAAHGRAALGINAMEDLFAIALLSLVSGFVASGKLELGAAGDVVLGLLIFITVTVLFGYVVVPRLVEHVARFHVSDVLVVTLVGIAFGLAILAERLGFAAAMGAFLAGFLIAGSERLHEVRKRVEPLRDLFGAVFFVSIGMLVDPTVLRDQWNLVLAIVVTLAVVKPLAVSTALVLVGQGGFHAFRTGLHLVPIGEMGIILASTAALAGLATSLPTIITGAALATALIAPLIARGSERITGAMSPRVPSKVRSLSQQYARWAERLSQRSMPDPAYRRAVRGRLSSGFVDMVVVALLIIAAIYVNGRWGGELVLAGQRVPIWLLAAGGALVLSIPPLRHLARQASEARELVVEGMTPDRFWGREDERGIVRRVVSDTFGAGALLIVAVVLVVAALPFAPVLPVVVVAGLLGLGAALLFSDAALALHRRFHATIEHAFREGLTPDASREIQAMMSDQYPWGVVFEEATVPRDARLAGRPLGELHIRSATGATIVSIRRGERVVVNPGAHEMLLGDDRVLIAGEPSQVVAARDLLAGVASIDSRLEHMGARTMEATVPARSPLAGRRLRDADLRRRTGAVVLALVRGGTVVSHPEPNEVLRPGDRVLLVGTTDQVERARDELVGPLSATDPTREDP